MGNRGAASGLKSAQQKLIPGTAYTITFPLNTTDHVIPAGHTLAVIIAGTDKGFISAPSSAPNLSVDLTRSSVTLPLSH